MRFIAVLLIGFDCRRLPITAIALWRKAVADIKPDRQPEVIYADDG